MEPITSTRREFLWILSGTLAACTGDGGRPDSATGDPADGGDLPRQLDALPPIEEQPAFDFFHGLASGDPLADRVVLWTRITPADRSLDRSTTLFVDVVVATDSALKQVVGRGRASTSLDRDYTVKLDLSGLEPSTTYYYRFFDPAQPKAETAVGRTRTLPTGSVERARFAVVSCACHALGYFNAYAHIAQRPDLDAVIHLGDYLYEYGPEFYADPDLGRDHQPAHEILTLEDYRTRHRQYKLDPDLMEAHRQHPFIPIWDDHEVANDSWQDGAQNHSPDREGPYSMRKEAAYRAYHEWMPIRDLDPDDDTKIYRSFAFGDLCDLIMLETRAHRDAQNRGLAKSPARTLMSEEQRRWLEAQLTASKRRGATFRLLGQQVMLGQLTAPGISVLNPDQWDGYAAERARLLDYVESEGIDNLVVLTGDIHSSWAIEVAKDGEYAEGRGSLAVEYVCTSVTSPGLSELEGTAAALVKRLNPHVKWVDLERRGYLLLDIDHTRVQGDWYHSTTVREPNAGHIFAKAYRVHAGTATLVEVRAPSAPGSDAPPLAPA